MLDLVETLKEVLGITTNAYDFIFIFFSLILIVYLFSNMLGLFKSIFDFVGGKR